MAECLRLVVGLACLALCVSAQEVGELQVGHWVRVKGALSDGGVFVASEVEVRVPVDEQGLVGTAEDVAEDGSGFVVLGLPMHVTARTGFRGIAYDALAGRQVKVEGHYRGPRKFSVRAVSGRRSPGRDRIEGRIDALRRTPAGVELVIMSFEVFVAEGTELVSDRPLQDWDLAPAGPAADRQARRDDDDDIGAAVELTETLTFGARLEWKQEREDNFNLNDVDREDRLDRQLEFRGELIWEPTADVYALVGFRQNDFVRREEEAPKRRDSNATLSEAFGYWRSPFGQGLDVQVGRQDFDEPREWLYDQNLDAVRLIWTAPSLRFELSASTLLADGSRRDKESHNYMAYLSNNDEDRHLGAYVIDRRRHDTDDKPIHLGVRALGDWLPEQEIWAEWSLLRGFDDTADFRGWGLDLGTTWYPPSADPFYFTVGYARGSGDDDLTDDTETAFRQTGLHDNNGKFGGVTSFRYYGELFEPELSNLSIYTLGVGARIDRRSSVDLVLHKYEQIEAATSLLDSNLEGRLGGVDRDLGWELDLVFGSRAWESWHLEVVLGRFHPGDAWIDDDEAWIGKLQVRYRF